MFKNMISLFILILLLGVTFPVAKSYAQGPDRCLIYLDSYYDEHGVWVLRFQNNCSYDAYLKTCLKDSWGNWHTFGTSYRMKAGNIDELRTSRNIPQQQFWFNWHTHYAETPAPCSQQQQPYYHNPHGPNYNPHHNPGPGPVQGPGPGTPPPPPHYNPHYNNQQYPQQQQYHHPNNHNQQQYYYYEEHKSNHNEQSPLQKSAEEWIEEKLFPQLNGND